MFEDAFLKDSIIKSAGEGGESAPMNSPSDFGLGAVESVLNEVIGFLGFLVSLLSGLLQSLLGG